MSAAVCARLVQAGGAAGLSQGQLAGDIHNLSAIVRVLGLFVFGRLYLAGCRMRLPSLPYVLCAATQFAAAALVVLLPREWWRREEPPPAALEVSSSTDEQGGEPSGESDGDAAATRTA